MTFKVEPEDILLGSMLIATILVFPATIPVWITPGITQFGLLALLALYFLGGEVLRGFTFAMIFGVLIGTYSSIFIAAPVLILFKLRPGAMDRGDPSPYSGQETQEVK